MAKVDRTKIPLNCFVRATQHNTTQNEIILLKRKISIGNKLIKEKKEEKELQMRKEFITYALSGKFLRLNT